jgi:hypothetical protein
MRARTASARALVVVSLALVALVSTPFVGAGAATSTATVTVLHGLPPNSYDIYVNGKLTLDGFKPLAATDPIPLPAGTYDLAIRNVGDEPTTKPILEATVTLEGGKNYSVIAHPGPDGAPTISLFTNSLSQVPAGKSRMVFRDVAEAPPVDVRLDGEPTFTDVANPDQREKVVSAGKYGVDAVDAQSSAMLVPRTPLHALAGSAEIVYLVGSSTTSTLDFMAQQLRGLDGSPSDVLSGTGGQAADPRFPGWGFVVVALSLALAGAAGVDLMRTRRVSHRR